MPCSLVWVLSSVFDREEFIVHAVIGSLPGPCEAPCLTIVPTFPAGCGHAPPSPLLPPAGTPTGQVSGGGAACQQSTADHENDQYSPCAISVLPGVAPFHRSMGKSGHQIIRRHTRHRKRSSLNIGWTMKRTQRSGEGGTGLVGTTERTIHAQWELNMWPTPTRPRSRSCLLRFPRT